jgi:hypothetical protein
MPSGKNDGVMKKSLVLKAVCHARLTLTSYTASDNCNSRALMLLA